MHHAKRVVWDNMPYLIRFNEAGNEVFGPYQPGSEPTLHMATAARQVHDPTVIARVSELAPGSPSLPFDDEAQIGADHSGPPREDRP